MSWSAASAGLHVLQTIACCVADDARDTRSETRELSEARTTITSAYFTETVGTPRRARSYTVHRRVIVCRTRLRVQKPVEWHFTIAFYRALVHVSCAAINCSERTPNVVVVQWRVSPAVRWPCRGTPCSRSPPPRSEPLLDVSIIFWQQLSHHVYIQLSVTVYFLFV